MIKDLKEFEKFLKICRKQGVIKVTLEGCAVELGDLPNKASEASESSDVEEPGIANLSEEELAMWSVRMPSQ